MQSHLILAALHGFVQCCRNFVFPDEDEKHASRMRLQSLIKFLQCSDCEFGHVSKPSRTQMDGPAPATAESMQRCKNEDSVHYKPSLVLKSSRAVQFLKRLKELVWNSAF